MPRKPGPAWLRGGAFPRKTQKGRGCHPAARAPVSVFSSVFQEASDPITVLATEPAEPMPELPSSTTTAKA